MSARATVGEPALEVRRLTAGYGPSDVIRNVDLTVAAGEVVAMLGRNGAGKTTTLMAIGGFISRWNGELIVGGKPISGAPHKRSRNGVGLLLEGRSVFAPLTTAQNLKIGGVEIGDALRIFPELEPRLSVRAGLLSGGEQQMLALARALCRVPRVLLVDEISFGLAPIICERLFRRIREFAEQRQVGVLLVEQHLHYAANVADRAIVLNQGEIAMELPARMLEARAGEIERLYLGGLTS